MSVMLFSNADVPQRVTDSESSKRWRDTHPGAFPKSKTKYRHNNSKWQTDTEYLKRDFVAYDGEGITDHVEGCVGLCDGACKHRYVMLAVKADSGESDYVANVHGLGTAQCFDFMLAAAERDPKAIHVIYGGAYDGNMILRDMNKRTVSDLMTKPFVRWNGYRVGYRQRKQLYVCRIDDDGNRVGVGLTLYDVVSFFQCAFVKACDSYLGTDWYKREMIVSNKALRSSFTDADIPEVREYNDAELQNLLALVRELRLRLNKVGLRPRRWDGPGAVAAALLMREGVKSHMATVPDGPARAARFAFAGGRFEPPKFGHVEGPGYEYDINSAYPAAMGRLPSLAGGAWEHVEGDPGDLDYAIYHVSWEVGDKYRPGPFFRRNDNGTISYPCKSSGWYWSPEVATGRQYMALDPVRSKANGHEIRRDTMTVTEAWVFRPLTDTKPFAFVEGLYNKRRALKLAGDGAHVGLKLALNSLFGKTCQQIGWSRKRDGTLRTPPFHQLEWAGFITSWCRAKVLEACLEDLDSVIAFETDAMFTSRPLSVKVGTGLGEWEVTEFTSLTYVSSGVYFGTKVDGEVIKTRGVDLGNMTRETALEKMSEHAWRDREVAVNVTRFVGARLALAQSWDKWRTWVTVTKHIRMEPGGKRNHAQHCTCEVGVWHNTVCPVMDNKESCEFPVEWLNPDPLMTELSDLRREDVSYE